MNSRKLVPALAIAVLVLAIVALFLSCGKNDGGTKATLYYVDGSTFRLVGVDTQIPSPVTVEKVLEALFAGQDTGYLENLVPEGTRLLSIENTKNTLTLNLSKEFEQITRGATSDRLMIMSIVSTALAASDFKQVKLLIEGEEKPFFNDTVYIKDPIQMDSSLIE